MEPFVVTNLLRYNPEDERDKDEVIEALYKKAESIDLDRLAKDFTYPVPVINDLKFAEHISDDTYAQMKKLLVAEALFDNLVNTEGGICIRWLMPKYDLADAWGDAIETQEWWMPPNGMMFRNKDKQQVLCTNASVSRNDRKVMLLFGVGYGKDASRVASAATFMRSDVKTLASISMSHLAEGQVTPIDPPILMKRNDDLAVWVSLEGNSWKGRRDHIIIYGWVAESMGTTRMPYDDQAHEIT